MKRLTGISALSLAILIGWFVLSAAEDPSGKVRSAFPGKAIAAERSAILQLTAGGYVIGFREDGVVFASGDHAVQVEFIGANSVTPMEVSGGESLEKVIYKELWDKIDLVYEKTSAGIIKSSYVVAPGGDPSNIRLRYNGKVAIDANEELVIGYKAGRVSESKPVAWQERGDAREPVTALYRKVSGNEIGFAVSGWDGRSPLVIDPVLEWNTFLGSNNIEMCDLHSISLDASGNAYVYGYGYATWGSPVRAYSGSGDVFVAKIGNSGNLLWNTFLGGAGGDYDHGIAVDSAGNVFVTGHSMATWGSPVRAYIGGDDAFVAKLDSSGNLLWNTFLGESEDDRGSGIVTDGTGNVFISGYSQSTWGSPVRAFSGSGNPDAFAAKLDSSGNFIWNTFLGGLIGDFGEGIAVDGTGNTFVSGYSIASWGSPVRGFSAGHDAFAVKLDSSGNLLWNTFLGGSGYDYGSGIAADAAGNTFISGYSTATWGSPMQAYSAGDDAMAAKLDSNGNLLWNTFLGGSGNEHSWGRVALDTAGNVFISGNSNATWGSPVRAYSGGWDAFAAKLNGSGTLSWIAFLGGSQLDNGYGIAVNTAGNVYVSGYSDATWGSPVAEHSGSYDVFAAKLRLPVISGNTGIGEVTLSYDDGGAKTGTSDSSGNYSISVSDNWSGTITPAKAGYVFTPMNRVYSNITADQTGQDYAATLNTYTITGTILVGGSPLAGVVMSGLTGNPATDSSGVYSGTVTYNWSGTVTPTLAGYTFSPANRVYANIGADQTGQDYSATNTYTITGTILAGGAPLAGVEMSGLPGNPMTNSSGVYSGTVPFNWSGTVTPVLAGHAFTPPSRSYASVVADQTGQNYEASALNTSEYWNTFLGSATDDWVNTHSVVRDGSGNIYVVGGSLATWGSPLRDHSGSGIRDAFVAKLDPNGNLLWNTFLGGTGYDHGHGIDVDGFGNVYVSGSSAATWGAPIREFTSEDAFVAKLNADGSLAWNTFLGGFGGSDNIFSIAVDASGASHVCGTSSETWGSPLRPYSGYSDALVCKLDAGGNLLWHTFLGGSATDVGRGIAIDGSGNIYASGDSLSTWGSPVRGFTASDDAFAAKLSANGVLTWNTFLGGSTSDSGHSIIADESGNIFVAGQSGVTWGTPVRAHSGSSDAFAVKLDAITGSLAWNTFLGSDNIDWGYGIACDSAGNVYVSGTSFATWGSPVRPYSADTDAFAAMLAGDGTLTWNTFLGGAAADEGFGIKADANGNFFVSGSSYSSWGTPVRSYSGASDVFAAKFGHQLTISGTVTVGGLPLAGVVMNGLPGNPATDSSGVYTAAVDSNWSGTATPTLAGYAFSPANRVYTNITTDQTGQDYTSTSTVYTISGTILFGGSPLAGVVMGGLPGNPATNSSGVYSGIVPFNWSGIVTPTLTGYTFSPENRTYANIAADQTAEDYAATGDTCTITVTSPNGGEAWLPNTSHPITWTSSGYLLQVRIELSTDNGENWGILADPIDNTGSFSWTVPDMPSGMCLIRITRADPGPPAADMSDALFTIIANEEETVSAPTTPSGPATGIEGGSYTYLTGGSTSSYEHSVQYFFDWGDTTDSGWLAVGTTSASHSWLAAGTYNVRAMARCASHTAIESAWSTTLVVTLDETPTWVAVSCFEACAEESQPTLEWHTASEIGTVGFNLWRQDKNSKKFELVNPDFLPSLPNSPQGGVYRLADPGVQFGEPVVYRLEEIDALGRTMSYGPFTVTFGAAALFLETENLPEKKGQEEPSDIYGYRRFNRERSVYEVERLKARRQARQTGTAQAAPKSKERVKITVKGRGLFYVNSAQIANSLGVSVLTAESLIRGHKMNLTSMGKNSAWLAGSNGAGIFFYNEGNETVFSEQNVFWLEQGSGLAMETYGSGNASPADASQAYKETLHFEGNRYALLLPTMDPAGDIWYWDYVEGGGSAKSFPVNVPDVTASGPATLTVTLQGATDTSANNDHHAVVSLNGTEIGDAWWDGTKEHTFNISFNSSLLNEGNNTISVSGLLDMGAPYSFFYVESFDLSYKRQYKAYDNILLCRGDGNSVITVTGFTEPQVIILDVNNPERPKQVTGASLDVSGRITFVPRAADSNYLVSGLNAALRPLAVVGDRPAQLKGSDNSAEYVVITPEEFKATAQKLADYRKSKGLTTMVATLEDIYESFNYGLASPLAVRDFLAYAYSKWGGKKVKYAVLIGKGTYDYKDYQGYGDNLLPVILSKTPEGLCAADKAFGDVKGKNGIPEIAIGRLPAVTNNELQTMIDKIKAYENGQGPWTGKALMIADNTDDSGDFAAGSDELAGLATGYQAERIYLYDAAQAQEVRARIIAGFNSGAGLVNYCGHAGIDQLAKEKIFSIVDAASLQNGSQLPLMIMLTCVAGRFEIPGFTCLGEALLLNDNGGIAGGLVPSGAAMHANSMRLGREFYKEAFRGQGTSSGTAWLKAMKNYMQQGGIAYMLNIYNWLGDPALIFK